MVVVSAQAPKDLLDDGLIALCIAPIRSILPTDRDFLSLDAKTLSNIDISDVSSAIFKSAATSP